MSFEKNIPDISIIIPTYNRLKDIKNCLISIKRQKNAKYEIILIDDASTDNLLSIKDLCDLYVKNAINLGPSYSRNVGILKSRGEILLFLDSDTELIPETLVNIKNIFQKDATISALGGSGPPDELGKDAAYVRAKRSPFFGKYKVFNYNPKEDGGNIYECDNVESAFLAVRKSIVKAIGGFDPYWFYMGEDRDFCMGLREYGYRLVVSPQIRAIHHHKHSVKYDDQHNFDTFLLKRYLEVAIKRGGICGGASWMIGHCQESMKPDRFFNLLKVFANYKALKKRKNVNYLHRSEMDNYYINQLIEKAKYQLPFKVTTPLKTPRKIVLFITSKCNAHCSHCFISASSEDIKIPNIFRIVDSLNIPTHISITGGEPFLREDINDTLEYLMKSPNVNKVKILTNGSLPDKIENVCRGICHRFTKPLSIQISLDGLGDTHDKIRNINNGFSKVEDSCKKAKRINREYPYFSFDVAITIMKNNIKDLEKLIIFLEKNKYPSKVSIVRGNNFSTFGVPEEIIDRSYIPNHADIQPDTVKVKQVLRTVCKKRPFYFSDFQKKKIDIMLDTLIYKKRMIPCFAGYDDAVIFSDGRIAICEQVKPYGHLSKWGWDLSKSWNSKESWEHRNQLLKCACIHGCNIVTSIENESKLQ